MLRIALCDDEEKHLEKMNALLESYLQSRPHLNGQVELFSYLIPGYVGSEESSTILKPAISLLIEVIK